MIGKSPALEGSRRDPYPSTLHVAALAQLRHYIRELDRELFDLPSTLHTCVTFTAAIDALIECQCVLGDVLRCVIVLNALCGLSPVLAVDVDTFIQRCIAVKRRLDEALMALVSANEEALLMS